MRERSSKKSDIAIKFITSLNLENSNIYPTISTVINIAVIVHLMHVRISGRWLRISAVQNLKLLNWSGYPKNPCGYPFTQQADVREALRISGSIYRISATYPQVKANFSLFVIRFTGAICGYPHTRYGYPHIVSGYPRQHQSDQFWDFWFLIELEML